MSGEADAKQHTAVVFGVGAPAGLGAALARRFAQEGLRTFVTGRTQAQIKLVADKIGALAEPRVADVTQEKEVVAVLDEASKNAVLDVVAFNVGNNISAPLLELQADVFETLWKQNALGGFLVARETIRRMLPQGHGTLLITGATASLRGRPPFTAFASAKAALRAVAQGAAREFGPQGIHVAHVIIDGVIDGDKARDRFPDFVKAKGEDGLLNPDEIAETYWALHKQPKSTWTHEVDLRPFKESF